MELPQVSIYFKFSSEMLSRNIILNVWQMVLANISIKGWIIHPYV